MTTVSLYGVQGWLEDLPSLNTGRSWHACTSFKSGGSRVRLYEGDDNLLMFNFDTPHIQVFLVTGGSGTNGYLASTELYDPSVGSWTTSGARLLPRPLSGLRATNVDDRVLVFGKDFIHHKIT